MYSWRCFVVFVFCCFGLSSVMTSSNTKQFDGQTVETKPQLFESRGRFKRSWTGKGSIKLRNLFRTAKHVYTDGASNVYVKPGTYDDALADFKNLKPTYVWTNQVDGKVEMQGMVGKRYVTIQNDGHRQTLTVTDKALGRMYETRLNHIVSQTIVYSN